MPVARLTSSRDIRAVFGSRKSAGSGLLVVHASTRGDGSSSQRPLDAGAGSRVAVVAGRRVGNAVARNRAKRRLRGALRDVMVPAGVDVVVTAKPDLLDAPYVSVRDDLQGALRRAASKVGAA